MKIKYLFISLGFIFSCLDLSAIGSDPRPITPVKESVSEEIVPKTPDEIFEKQILDEQDFVKKLNREEKNKKN
jgi:hypothetical protein